MLVYPNINPIAVSIGLLQVHWYGLMYLFGFIAAWLLANWRAKRYQLDWSKDAIADLIFYAALGVIIGGRLGYLLFYSGHQFWGQPWVVFKLWEGGMSFHGGLIGVAVALGLLTKKLNKPFLEIADFVAPLVPLGLAAGRLGNFINGELWGRPASLPWAMVFPNAGNAPRHPSQLYEFGLEGLVLFIIVLIYSARPRPRGRVAAVFLIGYAICRLFVECFREPDAPLGYIAFNWLTMGQLLSIPMVLIGLILWCKACKTT